MKRSFFASFILSLLFVSSSLWSQTVPCIYRLELKDNVGNGWNGAQLSVSINQQANVYTLLDGDSTSIYLSVIQNDQLEISFIGGDADEEVSFALYNEVEEELLAETGVAPFPDGAFSTFINCASCPVPPVSSVNVEEILALSAIINWVAPDPNADYIVELGQPGFQPGAGDTLIFQGNTTGLLDLTEKTAYSFYLSALCANGDTSLALGPFDFETSFILDVGATDIIGPISDCDLLPNDSVEVELSNFGAEPQSLIPFAYAVNGEPVNIDMPRDGIYTGVLGKDSSDVTIFDATADFTTPGEYFIEVWTEVEGDSDPENDTTSVIIYSIPTISSLPYNEDFDAGFSGWTIGEDSENPSWALGVPTGGVINRAGTGDKAWVTNLNGIGNDSELSYLLSPCMDLSGIAFDPIIAFQLWTSTEEGVDQFWLESSIDGGTTWQRVEGLNYDTEFFAYTGDNSAVDWERRFGTLTGLAGESDVRLRFAYFSDFATQLEGVGVDDIQIFTPSETDLLLNTAFTTGDAACVGQGEDFVQLEVTNIGSQAITGFNFGYQINGGPVATQTVSDVNIIPEASDIIPVNIPVPTSGIANINAWVEAPGDGNLSNDTIRFQIVSSLNVPFSENFETGSLPKGWATSTPAGIVTNGHGNESFVLSQNLRLQSPQLILTSPFVGPIAAGDSLSFDYRFVEFLDNSAKTLGSNDRLDVLISDGCGNDFRVVGSVDENTHSASTDLTTFSLRLDDYVGQTIQVRVIATWGGGNYWADLDNFNIPRCDGNLRLDVAVSEQIDGSRLTTVVPIDGKGPFSYEWTSGETTNAIPTPLGAYGVTVTDQFGCTGSFNAAPVAVEEIEALESLELFPNPSDGTSTLQLDFNAPVDLQAQVLNAIGQPVLELFDRKVSNASYTIDLNGHPAGLYFVRILVDGASSTKRLLLMSK